MAKTNNVIELNGNQYDAVTGAYIGAAPGAPELPKASERAKAVHRGVSMDGIKPASAAQPSVVAPLPVQSAPILHPIKKPAKPHPVKHVAAHQPQHAKTLMRNVVKSPQFKMKTSIKTQVPTDLVKQQPHALTVKPKLSSDLVDVKRSERSHTVPRSQQVERFRPITPQRPVARPAAHQQATTVAVPAQTQTARSTEGFTHPTSYARPAVQAASAARANQDMFDKAIARANSHEQPAPKVKTKRQSHKRAKIISFSATAAAVVLLAGFIAYQNRANLQMQLASAKAGFHATMPGYKPSGFSMTNLSYGSGIVTIGFGSPNDQSYTVTQKTSNWDSETLLENFVANANQPYQAYQAAGRTVYVYGNGDATWVNGGVWYQVSGNASLSKDQILDLATSM